MFETLQSIKYWVLCTGCITGQKQCLVWCNYLILLWGHSPQQRLHLGLIRMATWLAQARVGCFREVRYAGLERVYTGEGYCFRRAFAWSSSGRYFAWQGICTVYDFEMVVWLVWWYSIAVTISLDCCYGKWDHRLRAMTSWETLTKTQKSSSILLWTPCFVKLRKSNTPKLSFVNMDSVAVGH